MVLTWLVLKGVQKKRDAGKSQAGTGKRETGADNPEAGADKPGKALCLRRPVRDWLRSKLSKVSAPGKDTEAPQPAEELKNEGKTLKKPHAFHLCSPASDWFKTKFGEGRAPCKQNKAQPADSCKDETSRKTDGADLSCV
jgi:hypothetical protein